MSQRVGTREIALIAAGAGLIVCLCLGGAVVGLGLLFQVPVPYGPPPFLRAYYLQRRAQSQACPASATIVPGTYHADPVQIAGDWVVVTYTTECAEPGQPHQFVGGYAAEDGHGDGCGGASNGQLVTPSVTIPASMNLEDVGQCGGSGGPAGLSILSGYVSGAGAVTAQALFVSGPSASAPIRAGRFVIAEANGAAICSVRALDVSGAVLAENKLNGPGPKMTAGACP